MRSRMCAAFFGGLSVFFSSSAFAHISPPGEGLAGILLHPFTSPDHILTLVLAVVVVAYFIRKSRHSKE